MTRLDPHLRDLTAASLSSAKDLVAKLVANGILWEVTGQARNRRFMYQSYIDLFYEPDSAELMA